MGRYSIKPYLPACAKFTLLILAICLTLKIFQVILAVMSYKRKRQQSWKYDEIKPYLPALALFFQRHCYSKLNVDKRTMTLLPCPASRSCHTQCDSNYDDTQAYLYALAKSLILHQSKLHSCINMSVLIMLTSHSLTGKRSKHLSGGDILSSQLLCYA